MMPTEKRRVLMTVLDDRPVRVLGYEPDPDPGGAPFGATQAWAALDRFANLVEGAGRELDRKLTRAEWNLIADVNNGCADLWDYSGSGVAPLWLIVANVEDGQRLDGAGDKWFGDGHGDAGTKALLAKLRELTPLHGEAIAAAVRYFWTHTDLDHSEAKWWSVAYRTATPRAGVD